MIIIVTMIKIISKNINHSTTNDDNNHNERDNDNDSDNNKDSNNNSDTDNVDEDRKKNEILSFL